MEADECLFSHRVALVMLLMMSVVIVFDDDILLSRTIRTETAGEIVSEVLLAALPFRLLILVVLPPAYHQTYLQHVDPYNIYRNAETADPDTECSC